ncbi:MAG: MBL fold metallo-hydrolase [Ruminococcaceae bacterium]|nr:MBL fold metallo-hydrolase [Oscillospiraceae bacterium]
MKINYISHSSFMIEFDKLCMLFDYAEGVLPDIPDQKELIVFASHKHSDHYSQKIFQIKEFHSATSYVLSYDIGMLLSNDVLNVLPDKEYTTVAGGELLKIKTLKSTDCGVAYLIDYCGKVIYHSGDLHMWVWDGAPEFQNREMENAYLKEISKLSKCNIDVAFAVLDGRQEDDYFRGMKALLENCRIKNVFPMHMWGDYSVVGKFKKEYGDKFSADIKDVAFEGQEWEIL